MGGFIGNEQLVNGHAVVPGDAAGATAQFVVVGWSDNLGSTLLELEGSLVNPGFNTTSFLGESAVSGPIDLGDNVNSPAAILFSMNGYSDLQGFTLGEIVPEPATLALATMGGMIWMALRFKRAWSFGMGTLPPASAGDTIGQSSYGQGFSIGTDCR